MSIRDALYRLAGFALAARATVKLEKPAPVTFWCRGNNFDFPILDEHYRKEEPLGDLPWKFWNVRDDRTLVDTVMTLLPDFEIPTRDEDSLPAHDSLYDCIYQAQVHNACVEALTVYSGIYR